MRMREDGGKEMVGEKGFDRVRDENEIDGGQR